MILMLAILSDPWYSGMAQTIGVAILLGAANKLVDVEKRLSVIETQIQDIKESQQSHFTHE